MSFLFNESLYSRPSALTGNYGRFLFSKGGETSALCGYVNVTARAGLPDIYLAIL